MRKIIRDFVGTAKQLNKILNLNPSEEIKSINDYQKRTMAFASGDLPYESSRDTRDELIETLCDMGHLRNDIKDDDLEELQDLYADEVEDEHNKWGGENN